MAELVRRRLQQVGPLGAADGPVLLVVEMGVTAVDGKVGVGQGASGAVERIPVTVFTSLKPCQGDSVILTQ